MYPYNIARDVFMAEPECFMFPGHMKLYLEKNKKRNSIWDWGASSQKNNQSLYC